jgi:hypothetical protein
MQLFLAEFPAVAPGSVRLSSSIREEQKGKIRGFNYLHVKISEIKHLHVREWLLLACFCHASKKRLTRLLPVELKSAKSPESIIYR